MKITAVTATTVSVPLQAPIRHANGAHWGRFIRTLVRVDTDEGITGWGELGGGGESAEQAIGHIGDYLLGHDPFRLEQMRFKIANPTASLYNNRTQIHAALEFACLDIIGRYLGQPVHALLGGKVRDAIDFASYLFFRHPAADGSGAISSTDDLVTYAQDQKNRLGFSTHKLKGGVFHPDSELETYRALADAFPSDSLRYDPNCALSIDQAIRFGRAISDLNNDYFEDPSFGLEALAHIRDKTGLLTATNTVVVDFEQLSQNVMRRASDVVLLDTTFWGGIRACIKAAGVCDTMGIQISLHSSGELGIQLASMLHFAAVTPELTFAADAHYHHLASDVISKPFSYHEGKIEVPDGPGLGVEVNADKLEEHAEQYRELGGYRYDRDPARPDWFPLVPNQDWAQ